MYYGKAKVTVNGCKVNKAETTFCIYPGGMFTAIIMGELIKHVCHRLWRCMTLMVNKMEHKLNSENAMNNRHSLTMTQS